MTMPVSDNPDFIALDMDPTVARTDDAPIDSDVIALDMGAPVEASPVEASPVEASPVAVESISNGAAGAYGSIRTSGFVPPTARGGSFDDSPLTPAEIAQREANRARAREHAARVAHLTTPAATVPVAAPDTPPVVTGVIPREAILRSLANEGNGVMVRTGRADRRKTHVSADDLTNALGEEFANMAPRVKSSKAHFGEVMRGIKNAYDRHATIHAWCVTRRDMERKSEIWPADLASRWCVGLRDGSDRLGSLGDKVLVADLLVDDTVRFVGGTDEVRERVIGEFTAKSDAGEFNSTDLLAWLREQLIEEFHAIETIGAYYVAGNHPVGGRLDRFLRAVTPLLGRGTAIDDVITGSRLTEALLSGITGMLDEIESDWQDDCIKAQERDVKKTERAMATLNQACTDADRDLARRRAVVLPERASAYLRRVNDAQAYLDGLAKLIGDDTANVKARLASVRATVEARCDATSAMGAAIEMD